MYVFHQYVNEMLVSSRKMPRKISQTCPWFPSTDKHKYSTINHPLNKKNLITRCLQFRFLFLCDPAKAYKNEKKFLTCFIKEILKIAYSRVIFKIAFMNTTFQGNIYQLSMDSLKSMCWMVTMQRLKESFFLEFWYATVCLDITHNSFVNDQFYFVLLFIHFFIFSILYKSKHLGKCVKFCKIQVVQSS